MPKRAISVTLDEAELVVAPRAWLRPWQPERSAGQSDQRSEGRASRWPRSGAKRRRNDRFWRPRIHTSSGQTMQFASYSHGRLRGRCRFGSGKRRRVRLATRAPPVVAELSAAVTNTHALLFHAGGAAALGRRAAAHFNACERQQALLYVQAPSSGKSACSRASVGSICDGRSGISSEIFSATLRINRSSSRPSRSMSPTSCASRAIRLMR